jgi:hypothetical protein
MTTFAGSVRRTADRGGIITFRAPNIHHRRGEKDRRSRRLAPGCPGTRRPYLARDNPAVHSGRHRREAERYQADLIGAIGRRRFRQGKFCLAIGRKDPIDR